MNIRSLSIVLTELYATVKTLADRHDPPIDLDQESIMKDHALQSGIEYQAFRAIEVLVLSVHASGLTKDPALQQTTAYVEAVEVLRMSGKPLPHDL
jgi:hypothetical protein